MSLAARLYHGDVRYDFIGKRRRWYALSGLVLIICIVSLVVRGFHLGIDFKGGTSFEFPQNGHSISQARTAVAGASGTNAGDLVAQELATSKRFQVQTPPLANDLTLKTETAIEKTFGVSATQISISEVGSSWGSSVTKKAVQGLVVFLVVVMIYISLRFEPKMALAAIIALLHDLIVTAGIYSLVGFEVTPSTVIAVLTILGFSLYDTVVVFDKVRENTAALSTSGRRTYSQLANDAVDQTIMRSINTSIIALLPVASLLFIGAGILGAGTLEDLALAQFVGLASGAYSSIFIATPLLVDLKEREPALRQLSDRVARQQAAAARDAAAAVPAAARSGGRLTKSTGRTAVLDRVDDDPEERRFAGTADLRGPDADVGEPDESDEDTAPATAGITARPRQGGSARSGRPGAAGSRANKRNRPGKSGGKRRR